MHAARFARLGQHGLPTKVVFIPGEASRDSLPSLPREFPTNLSQGTKSIDMFRRQTQMAVANVMGGGKSADEGTRLSEPAWAVQTASKSHEATRNHGPIKTGQSAQRHTSSG